MKRILQCFLIVTAALVSDSVFAQNFDEQFDHWPIDPKINGTIIATNQLEDTTEADALFLKASGGKAAKIVGLLWTKSESEDLDALRKRFDSASSVELISIDAATPHLPSTIHSSIKQVTGLLIVATGRMQDAARDKLVRLSPELSAVLERGGTLYTSGGATNVLSGIEVRAGASLPEVVGGMGLIPDSVIETSLHDSRALNRLKSVLVLHPRSIGIGIDKNAALVLSGRKLRVLGEGKATVVIAANNREPFRLQTISRQTSPRQRPREYLIDLTQWRREAVDRTLATFPPAKPDKPFVENGTLVIVGGGGMPKQLMGRFVELAGGKEKARLVYVPCSERDTLPKRQSIIDVWEKMGVKHATFIHTKDRNKANGDEEFLLPLKEATGIWFGGGRQWNFSDSYYGTEAHRLMKEVVRLGGVVGGSSAGASIQARYLARATPIENLEIMAPGYERGGLGFISGVAIDQHFSQRGRQKDMTQLVNRYPQLLGIGIDEATAIVVRGSLAEVVGVGKTHFYNRDLPVFPNQPDFIALPAGSQYDLAERKVIKDTSEKDKPQTSELKEGD